MFYALSLYDWPCGDYDRTLYFRSRENAENAARKYMKRYVEEYLSDSYYTPDDFDYNSWDEYIEKSVEDWYEDEVFSLESVALED